MNPIVVATDFSTPAENAMLYAGSIAQKMGAPLVLLHFYQVPVSMSEVPVLMISMEELKAGADEGLAKAKSLLQKTYPLLDVSTENRLGDVSEELSEVCRILSPFAVVAGKHGMTGIERFLFGSTSLSMVRHCRVPVIIVPETASRQEIRRIALAVDDPAEHLPLDKIKSFVEGLGAELHIIHVQTGNTESKQFEGLVAKLNARCETIKDDEFFHGIQTYLNDHNIDLLITLPHKHSFVERLTFRTHTEELLKKITIPIACITEESHKSTK